MARTQTMVQLTDQLLAVLDGEAGRQGISRSALIRKVLTEHLIGGLHATQTAAIVDGYRRIPPQTPDGWGDGEALGDTSTRETLQRLDVEERSAQRDPW